MNHLRFIYIFTHHYITQVMYNIQKYNTSFKINNFCIVLSGNGSHATRGHIINQLPIPKCKTEFSKNLFFPSTIKLWNELHGPLRDYVNKSYFKKAVCSSKFKTSSRMYPSNIAHSTQVTFTGIRVGLSNLNDDLYC